MVEKIIVFDMINTEVNCTFIFMMEKERLNKNKRTLFII